MNYGPLIFLAAFLAMAASWFGFVLKPQVQTGYLLQTNTVPGGAIYPLARPGLAAEGLQVYRANGCAACHSQQLRQTGTVCDLFLNTPGTNQTALLARLTTLNPALIQAAGSAVLTSLPQMVLEGATHETADTALRALKALGAKGEIRVRPVGPDIARGWGRRRSVARDFLFDSPVMLGSQRVGPDLADVGTRNPDPNWHLRHLYAPAHETPDSKMPPYRFLFEKRPINQLPSPDALALSGGLAPEPGYEIVPRTQAKALVAYLVSLRAEAPLFEAPLTLPEVPAAATNVQAVATLPK